MIEQNFDLFGSPILPLSGRRGRPRHAPTNSTRETVERLHTAGLSHLAIAREVGITAPTLRMNYFHELRSASQAWRRREMKDQA